MADVSAKVARAQQLADAGRLEPARAEAAAALQKAPRDPAANATMARILSLLGRPDAAIGFARSALAAAPGHPHLLTELGGLLMDTHDLDEAQRLLARAVEADPAHIPAIHNLASVRLKLHAYAGALAACDAGLALRPGFDELVAKRAVALQNLCRSDEALAELERAAAAQPRSLTLAQARAVAMQYAADDPPRALEAHRRAAAILGPSSPPAPPRPRAPGAPLRVGLLSGDFRRHSVAYFVEPLLAQVDRDRVALTCYSTNSRPDATTARLKSLAPAWRDVAALSDSDLAATIRRDTLDVLVELSGLTRGERLRALLARPAPVQATYLGYPSTTGIDAIDFRIVDSHTDPAPQADAWSVERLARLDPCFLCFRPPEGAPPVRERAAGAPVVFACFNAATKVGPRLLALWSRVLREAPGSRLLLKNAALDEPAGRIAWTHALTRAGVDPARVDLRGHAADLADHLHAYDDADIALDTHPYAGTTTTCEALFMGVPVVTRAGASHASRVGLSLLTAVGLPELATTDDDAYVRAAVSLAADAPRRRALRASLRERLLASPLCDEPAFAARFASALERMAHSKAASAPA